MRAGFLVKEADSPGERFLPYRQFNGFMIPNCLAKYPDLSSTAKLVWGRLAQYAGRNGDCFPSYQTLADELGLSRSTILEAVKALEDKGFIERVGRPGFSTKFFFLYHQVFRPDLTGIPVTPYPTRPEYRSPPDRNTGHLPDRNTGHELGSRKENQRKSDARARAIPAGAGSAGAVRKADAGPRVHKGEGIDPERLALIRRQAEDLRTGRIKPGALPMPAHQNSMENAVQGKLEARGAM